MSGNLVSKTYTNSSSNSFATHLTTASSNRPTSDEPHVYVMLTKSSNILSELLPKQGLEDDEGGPNDEHEVEVNLSHYTEVNSNISMNDESIAHRTLTSSSSLPSALHQHHEYFSPLAKSVEFPPMKKPICLLFEDTLSTDYWNSIYNTTELWTCLYCGDKFLIKSLLKSHANEHRNEKNYSVSKSCIDCGEYFPTFSDYVRHTSRSGHKSDSFYSNGSIPTSATTRPVVRSTASMPEQYGSYTATTSTNPYVHTSSYASSYQSYSPSPRLSIDVSGSTQIYSGYNRDAQTDGSQQLYSPLSSTYIRGQASPNAVSGVSSRSPHFNNRFDNVSPLNIEHSRSPIIQNRSSLYANNTDSQYASARGPNTSSSSHINSNANSNPNSNTNIGIIGMKSPNKVSIQANLFVAGVQNDARGPGSCSWVLISVENGSMISQGSTLIHHGTVPLCPSRLHYEGLLMGIKTCTVKQISRVRVHCYSNTVLNNIVSGITKRVPVHIQEFNSTVQRFLSTFEQVEFEYISSHMNHYAMDLAHTSLVNYKNQSNSKLHVSVDHVKASYRDQFHHHQPHQPSVPSYASLNSSGSSSSGYTTAPSTISSTHSPFTSSTPSSHHTFPPFSPIQSNTAGLGLGLGEWDNRINFANNNTTATAINASIRDSSSSMNNSANGSAYGSSNRDSNSNINTKERNHQNLHQSSPRWG